MAKTLSLRILTAYLLSLSLLRSSSATIYFPATALEYRTLDDIAAVSGDGQTLDQPFQLCLTCRCCAAYNPTSCLSMPCCFGIACGLPNKPYGVCAFAPNSCNCSACL